MLREVPTANVSKFSREDKRFERAKVNSRCFHWFPAAILQSLRRAPHGVYIINTIGTLSNRRFR